MVVYGTPSINTVLLLIYNIDCPSSCCTRDLLYTVYSILYIVFAIAMRTLWVTCASLHPTYYTVSSAAFAFFVAFSFLFFFPPSVAFAFSLCFYPLVGSFVFVHPIFSCPADHVQYSTVQTVQYRIDNRVVEARSVKRTHTHTHIPGTRVGDGGKEAKKRKKPLNSCRRRGGNGGDFGGTRKRCRKGSVGPVAANSNIVEINKEAGGGAQGTLSLSKNCTSRESVSPLSRLIRGFRNKYH